MNTIFKKIAFVLTLIIHSSFCWAQNNNQTLLMNAGDSLRMAGDLKGSIVAYKDLVANDPTARLLCYNYACALAQDRQLDSCFKYLYKAIELEPSLIMLTDKDFYFARQDIRWTQFEETLVNILQSKPGTGIVDWNYARGLFKLGVNDQAYNEELTLAGKKLGMNSTVARALMDLKDKINHQNQLDLDSLVKVYGYPKISAVGNEAANAAFLIIQHSDITTQKKYLPIIKNLCELKEANWQSYALMYDRILVSEKKKQKYGSQYKLNEITNKVELFPLEDESKVDQWRSELGLQPLAAYLKFLRWQFEPKSK